MARTFRSLYSLICLGVLLTGIAYSPAYATKASPESEVYFYPAAGWSVAKKDKLCTISSRFNNGFLMNFYGGNKWIQGLDINFRQNVFEAGKTYNISLNLPGIKNTKLSAKSSSADTLSINLRTQKDLYQKLRHSAVMDLALESNEFRFYLTGFSKPAEQFERCMAGAVILKKDAISTAQAPNAPITPEKQKRFQVNESIAMEAQEKAKKSGIVEISPANPKPVVQEIPFKETHKLGGKTIGVEPIAQQAPIEKEILSTQESRQEPGVIPTKHKRLSEQLAEQIQNNPSLIDVEEKSKPEPVKSTRKALELPPGIEDLPVAVPERSKNIIENTGPLTPPAKMKKKVEQDDTQNNEAKITDAAPVQDKILSTPLSPIKTAENNSSLDLPAAPPKQEILAPVAAEKKPVTKAEVKRSPPATIVKQETYTIEADFRDVKPIRMASEETADLRKQVIKLEGLVSDLKTENLALNAELKSSLRESEQERLTISSDNWNLEQATMRFNEAERQIKRLGGQLQKERAQCNAEKQDLEAMLFDPQVTNQAQLARLSDLENQLAKAKRDLEDQRLRYEERLKMQSAPNKTY